MQGCAGTRLVLNSVIGNRYYAGEGLENGVGAKKRKRARNWMVGGWLLAVVFPRSVIEGVPSSSDNGGAFLTSADSKVYPSPSFSGALGNCTRDIEFVLRPDFSPEPFYSALFRG